MPIKGAKKAKHVQNHEKSPEMEEDEVPLTRFESDDDEEEEINDVKKKDKRVSNGMLYSWNVKLDSISPPISMHSSGPIVSGF